jgi:hypothetical protein
MNAIDAYFHWLEKTDFSRAIVILTCPRFLYQV